MTSGYLAVVLHAHLPFVRHPEDEDFLEEDWLYEAITETYIPLLWALESLAEDNIHFRLTISLTPTLISMLEDGLLRRRYASHLDTLCELASKEVARTRNFGGIHDVAVMYRNRFFKARECYANRWKEDLVGAFRRLMNFGSLEIFASAATHGYLPVLKVNPGAVRAQIFTGIQHHMATLNRRPVGFWLPECGYYPGVEDTLKKAGIRCFIVDSHALYHAAARPVWGVYAPLCCPGGTAAFGRDPESAKQVWSSVEGYPGDYDYREFYRDIGHDLELEYISPYIHKDGIRVDTGIKYYRITGHTGEKEPYVAERARRKAAQHAEHFLFHRAQQVQALENRMGRKPIVVAPYDAELFGHWWFEGPVWLELLFRKIACHRRVLQPVLLSEYLEEYPLNQAGVPGASSWGYQGYSHVWVNGSNDWIYRHLHAAAERMEELAEMHPSAAGARLRALQQAARELLLAQASDWAFIMTRNTLVSYAMQRTKDHLARFQRLYGMLKSDSGTMDEPWLASVERQDNIFKEIDYRVYRSDYRFHPGIGPEKLL
jgi:1,4-alpha-glucan branching enzyme